MALLAHQHRPVLALAIRLGAIAALSTMAMLIKLANARGINLLEILFWRQFISVPLIAGGNWQPIAVRIYTVADVFLDWHSASAMAVVMAVIQCVLVLAYQTLADRAARRQGQRA